jgi:hypothetical protein
MSDLARRIEQARSADQWVIEEVKALEAEVERLKAYRAVLEAEVVKQSDRIPDPDDLMDVTAYVLRYCPDEMTREMASRLRAALEVKDECSA